jgi:hypothetical protein
LFAAGVITEDEHELLGCQGCGARVSAEKADRIADPDLWKVSEDAASQSEFSQTKLAGQPVKVSGVIQYNFIRN